MSAKEMPPNARAALGHILSLYGYLIVAFDHPAELGRIFTQFAGDWSSVQPFQIVAKASYEEWLEQIEQSRRFGYEIKNDFPVSNYFFYRAVTE